MNKLIVGIIRVSTVEQNPDMQINKQREVALSNEEHVITLAGFESDPNYWRKKPNIVVLVEDRLSGSREDRKGYQWALSQVKGGWVKEVRVWRVDRIGRSFKNNLDFADACMERKVKLVGLMDGIDLETKEGRLLYRQLSSMAEYMREIIVENTVAGVRNRINTCKKCGKQKSKHKEGSGCQFEPTPHGGTAKGWTFRRVQKLLPRLYELVDLGFSHRHIHKVLGLNFRTIRKYIRLRDQPTKTRKQLNTEIYGKSNAKV